MTNPETPELAAQAALAVMLVAALAAAGFLAWPAVKEHHAATQARQRTRHLTRRLAVQAEQLHIHHDAQQACRRLQQQAWIVRRQMISQALNHHTPTKPHRNGQEHRHD